jgi:UDPglucose--hexose-1-phosphate uridylyltransferase
VAAAWRARSEAARDAGFDYVHAFVNEGRAAGASLAHTHSQLAWLPEAPPAVAREQRAAGSCPLCAMLGEPEVQRFVVADAGPLVLLCPPAGRAPFELLLAPHACEPDGLASELLADALALLAEGIRRLRAAAGPVALNAWLHTTPWSRVRGHWHLEVVPRTSVPAGLELGTELYVTTLPPEEAAAAMRDRPAS